MDRPNDRDYRNLEERNAAYWREQADKLAVTSEPAPQSLRRRKEHPLSPHRRR